MKQEPLLFTMIITPNLFPGRQSNQVISLINEVSIKVLCAPVQQAYYIASQVLACLEDWEITDSRTSNPEEFLPAKTQIRQSKLCKQAPTPTSHQWLNWNFVLTTVLAHVFPVIMLEPKTAPPGQGQIHKQTERLQGQHSSHSHVLQLSWILT